MEKHFHLDESFAVGDSSTLYSSPMSSQSFLGNINADCALFPLLSSPYRTTSFMPFQNDPSPKLEPVDLMELKIPKIEDMEFGQVSAQSFSLSPPASSGYPSSSLLQLPGLCSLEQVVHNDSELVTESYLKRLTSSLSPAPYNADYPYSDFQMPEKLDLKLIRQSEMSRLRRQKFRERINRLKKLLPSEKKMDTTATLDMAYKYIKFLQTQISVLEAMPRDCLLAVSTSTQDLNNFHLVAGGGELSRNQLLQILVNSPVIQKIMCSQGLCVYSIEQMVQIIARLFTPEEAFLILNSMVFSP